MRLYLDDCRPCPDGWVLARSVAEARVHLELGGVDELSLDHDLGACEICIATTDAARELRCDHVQCGYDLVLWMVETGKWPKTIPQVHSANPWGAQRMRELIKASWKQTGVL